MWVRQYILYHGKRHPDEMGEVEVREFFDAPGGGLGSGGEHAEPGLQRVNLSVPAGVGTTSGGSLRDLAGQPAQKGAGGIERKGGWELARAFGFDGAAHRAVALRGGVAYIGKCSAAGEGRRF